MFKRFIVLASILFCIEAVHGVPTLNGKGYVDTRLVLSADTIDEGNLSESELTKFRNFRKSVGSIDTIDLKKVNIKPFTNLADFIKGELAGAYIQQPSTESGSYQNLIIRGAGTKLFSNEDMNNVRATVFVNGVPMANNHNFAYETQLYKFNRIGPETDFLNFVDISAIESIEIVKDPTRLALLGPLAANGAILITTFGGRSGIREISVNSYFGINQKPSITPVNGQYENYFRQPFYALYNNTLAARQVYPGYLADSTNMNYYGASRWEDEYYRNSSLYSFDFSLRGGSERANFGFLGGHTKSSTSADNNYFNRYNALLNINMLPFEWFTVSAFINATRTDRNRNTSLRNRYAEIGYLPDLSTPLSPNLDQYKNYISLHDRSVNDNITNSVQGSLSLSFDILKNLNYTTAFSVDYTEGIRDLFYPSELMETTNYISNYYGYSQRYSFTNNLKYTYNFDDKNALSFVGGVQYLDDLYRFTYAKAFDGPNDFIKLNVVEGDPNKTGYLTPVGGLKVHRWYNTELNRLFSTYGKFEYQYDNIFDIDAVIRWDASSTIQQDSRWLFTPSASFKWNLNNHFNLEDNFSLKLSAGRVGKVNYDSRFAVGPQYYSNLNWATESNILSFFGNSALSRPYNRGWVGYDLGWSYVDQIDFNILKSFFNNRLSTNLSLYQKDTKNQVALIPIPEEYGYVGQFKNGLSIRNRGIDLGISADIFKNEKSFSWNSSLNLNLNSNKVIALPDNLEELVLGNRLLKVGHSADAFWLYENAGIYASSAEVPTSGGDILSFDGIPFQYGDAKWVDQNNDFQINQQDKVLKGNVIPKVFGGFNSKFKYKNLDLGIDLYFALGHKAINERAANKFNFINNEANNSIASVREIFHWQQDVDINKYPLYNVWSNTDPYRVDQDLFLENASFLKIRGISLGYDLTKASFLSNIKTLRRTYIYATVNNLYTFTNFSGNDPELVNFNGYYDGYGLPMTPTYSLGFKLDL
ncbi:SusC/RagA family TonB-linked outer membrane protein [Sphingobacterium bovistauri]|uniref:SusC/RagA family TonB-linked outer membrane protein n=1 Tax=Sphingobacterium bovistauri TaxID=2781959 RepID=A0ABS7Z725_9SPHI|nr:SusC/RagA family TonB-linked outer membrane protein [Sphingobacterium bovistauri]MCA5005808.1 SusC/RagA family TonB-linked outer membrane protein [Sphingobacterium bovistauri]